MRIIKITIKEIWVILLKFFPWKKGIILGIILLATFNLEKPAKSNTI